MYTATLLRVLGGAGGTTGGGEGTEDLRFPTITNAANATASAYMSPIVLCMCVCPRYACAPPPSRVATSIIIIGRATLRKLLRRHYLHNRFERDPEWAPVGPGHRECRSGKATNGGSQNCIFDQGGSDDLYFPFRDENPRVHCQVPRHVAACHDSGGWFASTHTRCRCSCVT